MVVTAVGAPAADGTAIVQLTFLNDQYVAILVTPPDRVPASVVVGGTTTTTTLIRDGTAGSITVGVAGFVRVRYTAHLPRAPGATAVVTLAVDIGGEAVGVAAETARATDTAASDATVVVATLPSPTVDTGNAFLGNLSAYKPVYAVFGPGTNTDGFIQISFKYQLFGRGNTPLTERSWVDGIEFGYTQRMYWDLGAPSVPFRDIDYQPELFYLFAARSLGGNLLVAGQAGFRHESNGRDGAASRSLNTVYFHPTFAVPIGRYSLKLGPQVWAYLGSLSDNPDIVRYRGNVGLFAEIGRDDGFRFTTHSRINFATGRDAIDAELSYPLTRIFAHGPDLYVFGQGFAGYGENLLDYNRRTTRVRVGFGFVR